MSLESPRGIHVEGANAPEHRPPRASWLVFVGSLNVLAPRNILFIVIFIFILCLFFMFIFIFSRTGVAQGSHRGRMFPSPPGIPHSSYINFYPFAGSGRGPIPETQEGLFSEGAFFSRGTRVS